MRLFISEPMAGNMTVEGTLLPFLRRYGQPESARSFMAYWWKLQKYGRNAPLSEWEGKMAPIDVRTHNSNFGREPRQPTIQELLVYVGTVNWENTDAYTEYVVDDGEGNSRRIYNVPHKSDLVDGACPCGCGFSESKFFRLTELESRYIPAIESWNLRQFEQRFAAVGWEVET